MFLLLASQAFAAGCGTLDGWDISIEPVENPDGTITFWVCRTGDPGHGTCGLSHFSLPIPTDAAGTPCGYVVDQSGGWVEGPDPSQSCYTDDVWKYDIETPRDGTEYCHWITLGGVATGCGDVVIKGGPLCDLRTLEGVPTCTEGEGCPEPTEEPDPCDPTAQGFTLTQGGWGSAKHFEAMACDIIATCPDVAADIATVASCYGWDPSMDLGTWVTGDCGSPGGGADGGFVPSGFQPGENGGSQLIAALLSIDGVACYGLDRVGGDPVGAVGRDWIILATGQTVGDVIDEAMDTCGAGYAGILGVINESWVEGFDEGTVAPCERE
jgi:hypothetical protein